MSRMDTAHYKVILAYNGSGFAGFQRQRSARTVQGEFETSLRELGWRGESILAAGRTDAGVHASGQVVSFKLDWAHSSNNLLHALNYYLPQDMAAQSVEEVASDFHPRYDAISRFYRYRCFCQTVRNPLREDFSWRIWPAASIDRMNTAAKSLIGSHDFKAFGRATTDSGVTVREVFSAAWREAGDELQFDIIANAFLYHMVRRIVLVLVRIGQGEKPVHLVTESLESEQMTLTGLAPSKGLFLQEVSYT